jgi:hypothetical protein
MLTDINPTSRNVVIDLGVYGADGFTIQGDATKRDTIPSVEPSLNHTTIGRLAQTVNDYEVSLSFLAHELASCVAGQKETHRCTVRHPPR